ncbi:lactonase family protein [Edaphobacter aggregans]|uniref:lactonase family protein n=1 Tax=Edaphobacter aggregans TaxID=570835 RepID=UPI000555E6A4|nr:beta-propeller fold lactonase family protein [Edaphobacter aggregans]
MVEMAGDSAALPAKKPEDDAMKGRRTGRRRGALASAAFVMAALTGCGDFFVKPDNSGGGGTTSNNRVYVTNSLTSSSLAGFTIGTGTLTAVPNSPLTLDYAPVDAVVTPDNTLLYVAGPGAIYVYTINSDGSLTASSAGAGVAIVNVASLAISPDGNWLFGLDRTSSQLDEFQINKSNGSLSSVAAVPYSVTSGVVVPKMVRVSPAGNLVFAALGTGGDIVFTLNTTTGAVVSSQQLSLGSSTTSDNALAINSAGTYLYIARSGDNGGVAVYTIGSSGALISITGSPFAAGQQPNAVVLDSTGKYVYVSNGNDGNISGYSIGTNSALTALTGSPYASGTQVNSLGADKSGTYVLAGAFGGGPDLSMYSIDATVAGKLNPVTSTASGTDPAGVTAIALTH